MRFATPLLALLLAAPAQAQAPPSACTPGGAPAADGGTRRALLIGVADYAASPDRAIPDLEGPTHDVPLVREALCERGFGADHIATLQDAEATHAGILGAIDALVAAARPGDHLVIHYSGHGSQAESDGGPRADEADGLHETLVPHDAATAGDILDVTLRQRLNRALDAVGEAGSLVVVQDNCHSGSGSRSPMARQARQAEAAPRAQRYPEGALGPPPAERGALVFAAAQEHEVAKEVLLDGVVYGGFTASWVRALRATPPGAPAGLVFERTLAHVAALGLGQEGVLEGPAARPLFGEAPAPGGALGVAAQAVDGDRVTLRGGAFMGLRPGAELVRFLTTDAAGAPRPDSTVRLRVAEADGAVRSVATVVRGGAVRPGDVFRITRPVPLGAAPLRLWVGARDSLPHDPAHPCPADACSAAPVAAPSAVELGPAGRFAGADTSGGVYCPRLPPAALAAAVRARLADVPGLALADAPADADYWLVGEPQGDGVRWVRRTVALSGDTLAALPAHRAAVPAGARSAAAALETAARRAARAHGWQTATSPETASFPVEVLGLRRQSDGVVLRPDASGRLTIPASAELCRDGLAGCYTLALGVTADALAAYERAATWDVWDRRYAYAFLIEPDGAACLYFPFNRCRAEGGRADNALSLAEPGRLELAPAATRGAAGEAPADSVHVFDLAAASPRFALRSGPFGRHTVVLVTSNEPIAQPGAVFNWPALDAAASRGDFDEPDSWSVRRLTVDVLPR